jgi:hypothetical protein
LLCNQDQLDAQPTGYNGQGCGVLLQVIPRFRVR